MVDFPASDIPDISGHVGTIPHIYIWNGGFHKWGNIPIAGWFTMEKPFKWMI